MKGCTVWAFSWIYVKAFDVCSHEILLKKLKKMGIQEKAHKWFESYLTNRTQCVDISGNFSD